MATLLGNLTGMTLLLAAAALAVTNPGAAPGAVSLLGIHPPKLVVLISVDQFRGDYVERFNPYFLPANPERNSAGLTI